MAFIVQPAKSSLKPAANGKITKFPKKHKQAVYKLSPQEKEIYKQKLKEIEKIIKQEKRERRGS